MLGMLEITEPKAVRVPRAGERVVESDDATSLWCLWLAQLTKHGTDEDWSFFVTQPFSCNDRCKAEILERVFCMILNLSIIIN